MPPALVVTSLTRHFGAGAAAAEAFMGALSARLGRPVFWDEREDAPLLREDLPDGAPAALVRAAVGLDDPPGAASAGAAEVEAARLRIRRTRFPHLVRAGPIFLPVGFDRPIEVRRNPLGEGVVGSSSRLLAELEQVEEELARKRERVEGAPSPEGEELARKRERVGSAPSPEGEELARKRERVGSAPSPESAALAAAARLARESVRLRLPLLLVLDS
jgi:hypothetical protein